MPRAQEPSFFEAWGRKFAQFWYHPQIWGLHYRQPLHNREDIVGGDSPRRQGKSEKADIGSDGYQIFARYWPSITSALHLIFLLIFYARVILKKIICSRHLCSDLPLRSRVGKRERRCPSSKVEQDDIADKLEKSGFLVVELREAVSRSKKLSVDEFNSSSEFLKKS